MPTLYVTEPNSVVRRSGGSLIVTLRSDIGDDKCSLDGRRRTLLEVEPHRLELIALIGRVHITSDATRLCVEQGIALAWFKRNGDFIARLVPELSRTADLRLAQFRMADDEETALPLARNFVAAKVHNACSILSAMRSNRPNSEALCNAISEIDRIAMKIPESHSMDTLRGLEGDAARRYFRGLQASFDGGFAFSGRKRRPPPDPVNALLSFCYVLLANALASLLEGRGFDPYIGFMHSARSGRPSLALDLMEELRHSVVDRFVLRTCNLRRISDRHFEKNTKQGGVRLTRPGLKKFFSIWEEFMDVPLPGLDEKISVEEAVRRQVDRLAMHVRGSETYQPLLLNRK